MGGNTWAGFAAGACGGGLQRGYYTVLDNSVSAENSRQVTRRLLSNED